MSVYSMETTYHYFEIAAAEISGKYYCNLIPVQQKGYTQKANSTNYRSNDARLVWIDMNKAYDSVLMIELYTV